MSGQLRPDGSLRHLLTLENLPRALIERLLEREILDNAWISVPVDARVVFELPFEQRWSGAWDLLGVNVGQLSLTAGHA